LAFRSGDHDSQIAVTLGTRAPQIFCHSILSLSQAFVHHAPRNLHPARTMMKYPLYGYIRM
jgi:hypothetical protein